MICFKLTATALLFTFFAFREHSQHPTTHFWLGTLHLHAAVKSLPWQRATSGSDIHRRPVWESKHTGRNLKLQPHGFSWTDHWIFSGTFKKLGFFPFNTLIPIYAKTTVGSVLKNLLLTSGGQNGPSVQHSCAHRLLLQHWGLPVLPRDHRSADEEKPPG